MPNNKALHIRTYKPKDITDLSVLLYRLIINQSSRDSYDNSETKDLSKAEIKSILRIALITQIVLFSWQNINVS